MTWTLRRPPIKGIVWLEPTQYSTPKLLSLWPLTRLHGGMRFLHPVRVGGIYVVIVPLNPLIVNCI